MNRVAALLDERVNEYAALMAMEMGKPVREGRAEVEKCSLACDYYAVHAEHFMQLEPVQTGRSAKAMFPMSRLVSCWASCLGIFLFSGHSLRRPGSHGGQRLCFKTCVQCAAMRSGVGTAVP